MGIEESKSESEPPASAVSRVAEEFISHEQRAVVASAIHRLGVSEAARRIGISNESVLRVAFRAGSQAGTEALTAARLDRLTA